MSVRKPDFLPFHRGRSPPFNLNFQQKIQIGGIRNDRESSETKKGQISNILAQIGALISNLYRHSGQSSVEQSECTMQKAET